MITTDNYDFLFANMQDGICITNKKGQVTYLNKAAGQIFNCHEEDTVGQRIWSIIPVSDVNDNFMQLFIDCVTEKQKTHQGVVDYKDFSGKIKKLRVCMHCAESSNEDEYTIVFTLTDLTELVRINKAFARYTSAEIAKYVLEREGGEDLGGDMRKVTILISDLRGFTALSTRVSPDDLITILNHYFESMSPIIEAYHGTIVEFLGDGLFVIFNAPGDVANHAEKAVACALEMENAMEEVNKWNSEHGFPDLEMGIGINTGEAVVGNVGSSTFVKYSCIGEPANLAGRVESFTVGGQIYISQMTLDNIKSPLKILGEHRFLPKGARNEVTIYDVAGIKGTLNIFHDRGGYDLKKMPFPVAVGFHVLTGKAVDSVSKTGHLVSLSKNYALLSTQEKLEKTANILIETGADLYAKVLDITEDGFILCFTSKPPGFDQWLQIMMDEL